MEPVFRVQLYLVGIKPDQARPLRRMLARVMIGVGKAELKRTLRRAHEGERVLIYQTNSDKDAESWAHQLKGCGATIEIEGITGPEPAF